MRRVDTQTRQKVAQQVIEFLLSDETKLPVEASYPLDQIIEAVEHTHRPGRWGKILLKP